MQTVQLALMVVLAIVMGALILKLLLVAVSIVLLIGMIVIWACAFYSLYILFRWATHHHHPSL